MNSVTAAKRHTRYSHHCNKTVQVLRGETRNFGCQKWYCLKKGALVTFLIQKDSATTITRFFRTLLAAKRAMIIRQSLANGDTKCPVCLTNLCELPESELFVHDGMVFCKSDIIGFVSTNYNFVNPMTRSSILLHHVKALGSDRLVELYYNRHYLRQRAVDASTHFFFLENDIVTALRSVVTAAEFAHVRQSGENIFQDSFRTFELMVSQMRAIDPARTICVLRSLSSETTKMVGIQKNWCSALIRRHLEVYIPRTTPSLRSV